MPTEVILPRVDMDMAEGRISRWYVESGTTVTKGQPLFEIETDKAAMEVEAPASGVIRDIRAELDIKLPVGSTVAWIDGDGEIGQGGRTTPRPADASQATERVAGAAAAAQSAPSQEKSAGPTAATPDDAALRATPLARRLARESNVDLTALAGSGPRGRVQAADVEAAASPPMVEARSAAARPRIASAAAADPPIAALNRQWLRQGEGTPLVLIHGFGADLNAWRLFVATTAQPRRPVLALDLPGHGGSAARPEVGFASMVAAVAATVAAENLGPVHLAGHSLGAAVAAALAGCESVEARSLLLLAPAGLGPDIDGAFLSGFLRARSAASLRPWIRLLAADPDTLGPAFVDATLRQRAHPDALAGLERVAASVFPDGTQAISVRARLGRLAIPAKVVFGAQDRIIPARHARGLPGEVAVHLFEGVGHMPQFEVREAVARLAQELLRAS